MSKSSKNRFLLLYGSQTGQAKAISEEIVEKAEKFGLKAELHCLSLTEKKFNIEREHCVVIVTSTTGDGEPPDTAQKFVRRLKKKTLPSNHLENLNYALLGLGDSNYTNFCNNGKTMDKRLEQLGAKRFYESGWADDAVGLEIAVEPWMEGLFTALQKFLSVSKDVNCGTDNCDTILNECISTDEKSASEALTINKDVIRTCNGDGPSVSSETSQTSPHVNGASDSSSNPNQISKVDSENTKSQETNGHPVEKSDSNQDSCDLTVEKTCTPSLIASVPPLSESSVSIPVLPAAFLKLEYSDETHVELSEIPLQNGCPLPSAASPVIMATVTAAAVLTREDAVKKTLSVKLDTQDKLKGYFPGDSISIVIENTQDEVQDLMLRLDVLKFADKACCVSVVEGTKKKNAAVPPHIPPTCTLRHIFTTCLDIREPPKKALLRIFVDYTSDTGQKRRLQELCSKQGATDYTQYIRQPSLSVMDILSAFSSCHPPVERLLEYLPRLQPRPYSICSSPLTDSGIIEIVFNLVTIPEGEGRSHSRQGICTGMLHRVTKSIQTTPTAEDDLSNDIQKLQLDNTIQVPVFNRTNQHFRMPDDLTIPIIMIGPGTGVAPFVGFLRHREALRRDMSDKESYGETWLFYGCRHQDRDYLFRKELERFHTDGVLSKLCVSFSRDQQESDSPRYVQDNIKKFSTELSALITEKNAIMFVCGDAKNMAKDVNEAITAALQSYKGCTKEEASAAIMKMRLHKTYLEDVWT